MSTRVFFIIYNTFSYPGGQDRKWRAELLNWKCLQFYQPEIIILQNTRIVVVFSYVSQIMFFSSLNNLIIFPKHAFSHSNNYWWKKKESGVFLWCKASWAMLHNASSTVSGDFDAKQTVMFWRIKGKFVKRLSAIASSKLTNILSL